MPLSYAIVAAVVVSLLVMQINQRVASPLLSIVDRWLRWIIFSFGGAYLCLDFKLIDRPFWVLVALFFIIWFLAETLLNWLRIHALSISPLPLVSQIHRQRRWRRMADPTAPPPRPRMAPRRRV